MAYTIEVAENKRYIIITVEGDQTNQLAMEQNIKAHEIGNAMGISRFLVDLTHSQFTGTALDHYKFAYEDMSSYEVINRNARVATLVAADDHSHDFVETVASNAGMDVTIFRDRAAAIAHLERD